MSIASQTRPVRSRHGMTPNFEKTTDLVPVLPRPPAVCEALQEDIPELLNEVSRIQYLAEKLSMLPKDTRMLLSLHIQQIASHMVHSGASDMDAGGPASNGQVWYRIEGIKKPCEELGKVKPEQMDVLILNMLSQAQLHQLVSSYSVDFSYEVEEEGTGRTRRFRASVYFDEVNLALNLRVVKSEVRPLASLGFHQAVKNGLLFSNVRDGLTIISGVTGAGKTTTLDSIIDANNRTTHGHIVVIGDPIEYRHTSDKCIVRHREVRRGVASYKDGIVQALHQDPDMIVVGEMLDRDTISAVMDATDSGHRVYSTLHTRSAVDSIERIVAEYPSREQERVRLRLADVLNCVVSQKLCPSVDGGRVLAKEVMWVTPSIRAAIKNGNTSEIYQMMWEGSASGQQTMEQDLHRLYRKRMIEVGVAMSFANSKKRMKQLIGVG